MFPDSPEVVEGIEQALTAIHSTSIPARVRVARAGSDTAANLNISESVSTVQLFAFGYMNPTAAAARRLTGPQLREMEALARRTSKDTLASVLASPQEYADLLRAVARRENPNVLRRLRQAFFDSAQESLRFQLRVEPSELLSNASTALEDAITRSESDYEIPEGMGE